jgi:nitrite reductase/ring-hydroxylating ferredoxin subunit/multimeric flavodoxin WrbA
MAEERWIDVGASDDLSTTPLRPITADNHELAVSIRNGQFGVVSNVCNHVGGPLGEGRLDGDYITCPWHNWKFHRCSGKGEPGFEEDAVPAYAVKVERGRVLVDMASATKRTRKPHAPHPLARRIQRAAGPIRVAGISTSPMDEANPRFSGSDHLLRHAVDACAQHGAESRLIRLSELRFRACEGYYSKSARACTWPCSITQMDETDQMDRVYEALVHWADAIIVATPIRWGAAASLYFKMAERLNCVQNAITIRNQVLIRNKVAGFVIVGGQDNIQGVAGQMLGFFAELGFVFPQFPYVAHSRGWSSEDMERNVEIVRESKELADGAAMLAKRCIDLAQHLIARDEAPTSIERGGRKAFTLDMEKAELAAGEPG